MPALWYGSTVKERTIWLPVEGSIDDLDSAIALNGGRPRYVRIQTPDIQDDLLRVSLRDDSIRELVCALANRGYYLYYNNADENRFVRHDRVPFHWPAVKNGIYNSSDDGLVYSFEESKSGTNESLVVVFSPINSKPRLSRYFWNSFGTLGKFITPDTAILRIADVGGVKGAFYMDTSFSPNNSVLVRDFIRKFALGLGVRDSKVVLYGASKGGTGSLYHGLSGGWKFVSVDPILSDEWYEEHENDYHFTRGGVFSRSKQEVFSDLISNIDGDVLGEGALGAVITSARSPQYACIVETLEPISSGVSVLNSLNSDIREHPHVAPKTIYAQVMMLNIILTGLPVFPGESVVP